MIISSIHSIIRGSGLELVEDLGVVLGQTPDYHRPCLLVQRPIFFVDLKERAFDGVGTALVLHAALRTAVVLLLCNELHRAFPTVTVLNNSILTEQGSTVFGFFSKQMQHSTLSSLSCPTGPVGVVGVVGSLFSFSGFSLS